MNTVYYDDNLSDTESQNDEFINRTNVHKEFINTYFCPVDRCNKRFKNNSKYLKHISTHYCERLFKCEYEGCSKLYKSKENLTIHVKNKHLLIKPYKYRYCESLFSHRNGKIYHERRMHKIGFKCRSN